MANKVVKACYLCSKANYSVRIVYDGKNVMLPPFANKIKIANESKLGALPPTVRKVPIIPKSTTVKQPEEKVVEAKAVEENIEVKEEA